MVSEWSRLCLLFGGFVGFRMCLPYREHGKQAFGCVWVVCVLRIWTLLQGVEVSIYFEVLVGVLLIVSCSSNEYYDAVDDQTKN